MKTFAHIPLPIPMPVYAPADPPAGDPPAGDPPAGDPPKDPPAGDPPKDPPAGDPPKVGTALDPPAGDVDEDLPGAADFPEDWRERLAGGDEKKLDRLKRFTDPSMMAKALFDSLEAARKKGGPAVDLNAPPPEDAEELKAYRAARGVPEEATGYAVPETIAPMVTDEDKPMVSKYFEDAHAAGMPKRAAEWAVQQYFELRDAALAHESENDKQGKADTTAELKQTWGPEFKANNNLAREMVKKLGEESGAGDWFAARMPDGRMLGNVPGFVQLMAQMGKREFGDEAFAGDANSSQTKSRKEELLNIMKTDIRRWNESDDLRAELFKINEAEARRNGTRE
jgi:hypothetical protein